jgi:hypothetical protein
MTANAPANTSRHTHSASSIRKHYPEFMILLGSKRNELLSRCGRAETEGRDDLSGNLIEIHFALNRMKLGTYEICEECRNPISIETLRVSPVSKSCIECQTPERRAIRSA